MVHATTLPCIHEESVPNDVMQKRPKMQKRPNGVPATKVSSGSLFYANVIQKRFGPALSAAAPFGFQ